MQVHPAHLALLGVAAAYGVCGSGCFIHALQLEDVRRLHRLQAHVVGRVGRLDHDAAAYASVDPVLRARRSGDEHPPLTLRGDEYSHADSKSVRVKLGRL